jgi:hypothetical protein
VIDEAWLPPDNTLRRVRRCRAAPSLPRRRERAGRAEGGGLALASALDGRCEGVDLATSRHFLLHKERTAAALGIT